MSKPSNLRIEDVAATTARADLNDILISLASLQTTDGDGVAYTGEPTSTYPNMLWYDKATSILKLRTTADDAWVSVAYVDQTADAYRIIDDTQVVNTSGTQTGLIGDQSTATWESGVGTTESLVSPAKVSAAIQALAAGGIGDGQTWQSVSRSNNTTYTNTTGKPIMVNILSGAAGNTTVSATATVGGTSFTLIFDNTPSTARGTGSFIVPIGATYSVNCSAGISEWRELR